jgi:hypothetical protein
MKRTDGVVLLDRSGSMQSLKDDHEGGLRSFITDQKSLEGDVRFTFIQFDSSNPCEILFDAVPISEINVDDIKLIPRGGTPLLDAMMKAAAHAEQKIPAESNTVFMTITDGQENQSREATRAHVRERIEALQKKGWACLFLGAGIDAFAESHGTGVGVCQTAGVANTPAGIHNLYANAGGKVFRARTSSVGGQSLRSAEMDYSNEERSDLVAEKKTYGILSESKKAYLAALAKEKQQDQGAK